MWKPIAAAYNAALMRMKASKKRVARPPELPDAVCRVRIHRRLLAWFDRHRRDLPWRRSRDPYRVWLSEMMLQQTQVATVIPYYQRFLARFPSVFDLAAAPLDDVLRLWSGLGYYARARNLHRAAVEVATRRGGRFPDTVEGLRTLPGIGDYTAGAIASIAFGRRAAIVDGNVARVLARMFAVEEDVRAGPGRQRLWQVAECLAPARRCGDFNEALMELGATVCLPRDTARCAECPLKRECRAHAEGRTAELPAAARRALVRAETHAVAAIACDGRWLAVRRREGGLWGGLWELPTAVVNGESPRRAAIALTESLVGAPPIAPQPFGEVAHQLTHRSVRFVGFRCDTGGRARAVVRKAASPGDHDRLPRWLSLDELESLGISTAMRRIITALRKSLDASTGPRRRRRSE